MIENISLQRATEDNIDLPGLRFRRLEGNKIQAELNTNIIIPGSDIEKVIKVVCRKCSSLYSCLPAYLDKLIVEGTHAGTKDCLLATSFVSENTLVNNQESSNSNIV